MNRNHTDIAALRENYSRGGIEKNDLAADPIAQFSLWFDEAISANLVEPNAMSLATVSAAGEPSVRTVLLKGLDERGFCFFTNYQSHKAQDMAVQPNVAASFLWKELERQVNVMGRVEKISREESAEYFHSRPRASQIGAWVSENQSGEIKGREYLAALEAELEKRFEGNEVPLPDFWGGYLLRPKSVEFWQGRESRLHDRLQYQRSGSVWVKARLSP